MEPVRIVTGPVAHLDRAHVDTDQIIPKQFLKRIERSGFGEFLFFDWRDEDFYEVHRPEYEGARILVTGHNFGCGSSREHAPWALYDHGFRVIIAPSFADIFHSNCTKIGLLPVVLAEEQVRDLVAQARARPGAPATVDLELQVVIAPDGTEYAFDVDPIVRHRLMHGLDDISLTLSEEDAIAAYEREREREGPVTTSFG